MKRAEGSKEEGRTVACTLYEARGESTLAVSADDLLTLRAESAEASSTCPLLSVLSKDPKVELVESAFGEVPFGGTLAYHLRQDDKVPLYIPQSFIHPQPSSRTVGSTLPNQGPEPSDRPPTTTMFIDLPLPKEAAPDDHAAQPVLRTKAIAIERRTQSQGSCPLWHELRKSTLTASRFHRVVIRKAFSQDFANDLMKEQNLPYVSAIAHGREKEDIAREEYVSVCHELGKKDLEVQQCGLVLHPVYEYLGASPDGQVYDPSSAHTHGLLEIKCPAAAFAKDLTPEEACEDPSFFCELVEQKVCLKDTHRYFTQVQGQLAVTGLPWCDFVVWTGPGRMSCERIFFDEALWKETLLPPLLSFSRLFLTKKNTSDASAHA